MPMSRARSKPVTWTWTRVCLTVLAATAAGALAGWLLVFVSHWELYLIPQPEHQRGSLAHALALVFLVPGGAILGLWISLAVALTRLWLDRSR